MPSKKSDTKSVLLVHPVGNANVRQAALALHQADMLFGFHTTIAWRQNTLLDRLLPEGLRAELARRSFPGIPQNLIHAHPFREAVRLIAGRRGWQGLVRNETGPFSIDRVCLELDRAAAQSLRKAACPDAVYAFDDCALQAFTEARARGIRCIYELPIGYLRDWAALRDEEIIREPLWGQTISARANSEAKLARKDAEIAAADEVIVPSEFVARTLARTSARKVMVVPYGCPEPNFESLQPASLAEIRVGRRLQVLYVGAMNQRKGISYLLRAMDQLEGVAELSLIGRLAYPSAELAAQLNRHRWTQSAPHGKVLEAMRNADVLVLPTLFEGRALVVLEALSQGIPVITTPNSGTEDVVLDGITGFVIPIRSAEAIAARVTQLADNRDLLMTMRQNALRIADQFSWDNYRARLQSVIAECLSDSSG